MSSPNSQRLRVLVSAFACCPASSPRFSGGEDVLGWHLVQQIGRFHDVWVFTHDVNREAIERERYRVPGLHEMTFIYVGLPPWLRVLLTMQGGHQFYAYLWQIQAYVIARRLVGRVRFDLIHQLTYANDWMASYLGAFLKIPYVRGPCGGAHRVPPRLLSEFTLIGRVGERFRSFMQWVLRRDPCFRQSQERARKLLVCNDEALAALPEAWQRKAVHFPVNGISQEDLALLERTPPSRNDGKLRVLSAGKLIRLKGFGLGIKAFKQLSDHYPDAHLEIIGDGPDRRYLESLITSMGLERSVTFTPWKARGQFLTALQTCDVFLFPSMRDGGGAVVVEAMAAGKPVICLNLGGPRIHVTEACGIRVEAQGSEQTVVDLTAALEQLARDAGLRERLGAAGRVRAEACYHWDRIGERLQQVYCDAGLTQPTVAQWTPTDTPVAMESL